MPTVRLWLPRKADIRKLSASPGEEPTKLTKVNSVSFVSGVLGMDPDFGAIPTRLSKVEFWRDAAPAWCEGLDGLWFDGRPDRRVDHQTLALCLSSPDVGLPRWAEGRRDSECQMEANGPQQGNRNRWRVQNGGRGGQNDSPQP